MTKAAHIYFRASAVYQTPTTDFEDHADALEQSCSDLIGVNLEGLSTGCACGPVRSDDLGHDCAVASMAAVELREDPSAQCAFKPLLDPTIASPVRGSEESSDRLPRGLRGRPAGGHRPTRRALPAGRARTGHTQPRSPPTVPARRRSARTCRSATATAEPVTSPSCGCRARRSPSATILNPRLTFEHYVATEQGWDGGNLKISVNGGAFQLVPPTAFIFNPYNQLLNSAAQGNTNPLAGQPGYGDGCGGEVFSSWKKSQVDLTCWHCQAGRQHRAPLRLRNGRLHRCRRLVRRRREGAGLQHEEEQRHRQARLTATLSVREGAGLTGAPFVRAWWCQGGGTRAPIPAGRRCSAPPS